MKRLFFSMLALTSFAAADAQTKPKPVVVGQKVTVPNIKPTAAGVPLKNLLDSFSYAAGYNIAMNMKEQGITNINTALCQKALSDAFQNKPPQLNQEQVNSALQNQLKIFNAKKEQELKAPGLLFLEANKKKPGVVVLPDGLQYEVLTKGAETGTKPKAEDTVIVNYAGTLINGTEFDNSFKRGQPATFKLNQVIRGWTEILQLMTVGAKWKVFIPSELAYGMNPRDPKTIPPGSVLVFEIELEGIKPDVPAPSH